MRISKEVKSPTKLKLVISADSDDLAPIKHHVLSHFAKSVKVPGFRAGHAPANMIEKHVNQQALLDEFMEHAVNDLYNKAIDAEKVRPAGQPNITLKKFVPYTTLDFDAELEAIAEIKLAKYKTIKLDKPKVSVTAKDVSDIIKTLQTRMAERVGTSQPAKSGDELIIDFEGFDKSGKPVNGADGKEYPLMLGSDTFIPGFESKLIGVKGGESKEFDITFPADYSVVGLQKKVVTFKVNVKKVSQLKEPKVDDKFASEVGPFKNLAELKADIKKQITIERQNEADRKFENELVGLISEGSTIEIPDSLIEQQVLRMEEDEKANLLQRGQTWQEHLDQEGINEQQHRDRHRPDAVARVKGALVLSEIAELEDVEVTPEELEIRMQLLKGQYQDPQMQAELDKPENRREIAGRLMNEKTLAKLVNYATSK
jgi:trigger factor